MRLVEAIRPAAVPAQPGSLFWASTLRVLAALAVVTLHTSHFFVVSHGNTPSFAWWFGNTVDAAMRWCVPVFVLVSGALLLDPRHAESPVIFARKRARRVLIPLAFWSAVYLSWRVAFGHLTLAEVPRLLLEGIPYYHLWYLYMIPGLYLFTPFLRSYIRSSTDRERWYLTGLLLLLASVNSYISSFLRQDTQSFFTLFIPYLAYYLAGYQLRTVKIGQWAPRLLAGPWLACTALTALGTGILVRDYGTSTRGLYLYDYFSPPVMVAAIVVFLLVRWRVETAGRMPPPAARAILAAEPATLGIYVIHALVLAILQQLGALDPARLSPVAGIPLVALFVFGVSYLVTRLFLRLPILAHTVR